MQTSSHAAERSFTPILTADLERLVHLALEDLEDLFGRRPETGSLYRNRLLMLCLCQGGAEHFVRGQRGIKDLDIWAFFSEHPTRPFPYRRRGIKDYGPSPFGRHPGDVGFQGRRVDIIGRSIRCDDSRTPADCIRDWLEHGRTVSARLIALSPVISIYPKAELGQIVWDPHSQGTEST